MAVRVPCAARQAGGEGDRGEKILRGLPDATLVQRLPLLKAEDQGEKDPPRQDEVV